MKLRQPAVIPRDCLCKELTHFDAIAIVVGTIIGSGIFLIPSMIAEGLDSMVYGSSNNCVQLLLKRFREPSLSVFSVGCEMMRGCHAGGCEFQSLSSAIISHPKMIYEINPRREAISFAIADF